MVASINLLYLRMSKQSARLHEVVAGYLGTGGKADDVEAGVELGAQPLLLILVHWDHPFAILCHTPKY